MERREGPFRGFNASSLTSRIGARLVDAQVSHRIGCLDGAVANFFQRALLITSFKRNPP